MSPSPDALRDAIRRRLADAMECAPEAIDPRTPFANYGLGSRDAVVLSGELEELLGRPLSPAVFYEYPTLDALVAHLMTGARPEPGLLARAPAREPVAIIGLACRFPGAPDASSFWRLLAEGRDAVRPMPATRRALIGDDGLSDIPPFGQTAGYIDDVEAFDAEFFGLGDAEADGMDPQQRLLLELSWTALESAGQPVDRLQGTQAGVFVGLSTSDYALLHLRGAGREGVGAYFGTAMSPSVAAGRIAYHFGLEGPAVAIDTACSSSLMAVHLAVQSLDRGETTLALAGGVNLILAPETMLWACRAGILSPDGRCRTFDARANGYVRGEGGGLVVLKRLADARRDGDDVIAVIRGTAANHDGRSSGLTAPNGLAQERVIASALAAAGVSPREVDYVEAHGTGTSLGDPIEARALGAALCAGRETDEALVVGSVKTNIGHLEAAAGIAGLIKTALAVRAGQIPAHLHLRDLNPLIASERLPIHVPVRQLDWPAKNVLRTAGVSAFGLSGTNVHVLLSAGPAAEPSDAPSGGGPWVLPLSAHRPDLLRVRATALRAWLRESSASPYALCASAAMRMSHHASRLAVCGTTLAEFEAALSAWLDAVPHTGVADAPRASSADGTLAQALAASYLNGGVPDWQGMFDRPFVPVALPVLPWARRRHWLRRPPAVEHAAPSQGPVPTLAAEIDAAAPGQQEALLLDYFKRALSGPLRLPPSKVPERAALVTLGLDSLMAIDLTNQLAIALGVSPPPADQLQTLTLVDLVDRVLELRAARRHQEGGPAATGGDTEEILL
jgi:acyl transferase domain-containing protein